MYVIRCVCTEERRKKASARLARSLRCVGHVALDFEERSWGGDSVKKIQIWLEAWETEKRIRNIAGMKFFTQYKEQQRNKKKNKGMLLTKITIISSQWHDDVQSIADVIPTCSLYVDYCMLVYQYMYV